MMKDLYIKNKRILLFDFDGTRELSKIVRHGGS